MTLSNKEIAQKQEKQVIEWVCKLGWVTQHQVERTIWPDVPSGRRMARRLLVKMKEKGLLINKRDSNGNEGWFLTKKGVVRAREFGLDDNEIASTELEPSNYVHRVLANDATIEWAKKDDLAVYSEYEILRGRAPESKINGRVPDALVVTNNDAIWVEVENARKSSKAFKKKIDWLVHQIERDMLLNVGSHLNFAAVAFVYDAKQNEHRTRIENTMLREMYRLEKRNDEIDQIKRKVFFVEIEKESGGRLIGITSATWA